MEAPEAVTVSLQELKEGSSPNQPVLEGAFRN
jgi:hypothetical protein